MSKKTKTDKNTAVTFPKIVFIEGALMGNGEFIHFGKSLGFVQSARQMQMVVSGATKLARGGEVVIALNGNIA